MTGAFSPGDVVHVGSRGVDRRTVFANDDDRGGFMWLIGEAVREGRMRLLNHCLMGNHFHLVVELRDEPLGRVMRDLLGHYARGFNLRDGRDGHLFERTYWRKAVISTAHMVSVARYLAYNPVEAGLCRVAREWRWSAHRALVGEAPPGVTDVDAALARLGGRENYVRLVSPYADARERALCELRAVNHDEWRRQAIAAAHVAGCRPEEIAAAAACSVRTVRRYRPDRDV